MDRDAITRAIEDSLFDIYKPVENFMGIEYTSEFSHMVSHTIDYWEFNRNRVKAGNDGRETEIIDGIMDKYKPFGWQSICFITGPNSETPQLKGVLESKGFAFEEKIIGMTRSTDMAVEGEPSPYDIREIALEDWKNRELQATYEKAYGMPEGAGGIFYPFMQSIGGEENTKSFVAYDGDKPIGVGVLVNLPGTDYALFGGAATLDEYRGKGIYTSMLRVRNEAAKVWGKTHVVIQAKEGTSAPIAARNGFEKICELEAWKYEATETN